MSNESLLDEIKARTNSVYFQSQDGYKMHYLEFGNDGTPMVLFPGMGEAAVKYWELAKNLVDKNYSVYILDHLGHGFSDHPLSPQEIHKVHIDDFRTYVSHAEEFFQIIQNKHGGKSPKVLAHSMGGLIACCLAEKIEIETLILSSPMLAINTKGIPYPIAQKLAQGLPGNWLAPLQKPMHSPNLKKNLVIQCQERANQLQMILDTFPKINRKGVTNSWLASALDTGKKIITDFKPLKKPKTFLFQAQLDVVVQPKKNENFSRQHSFIKFLCIDGAKHEVLMEKDIYREKAINTLVQFINRGPNE